jgi:hypothetical protein
MYRIEWLPFGKRGPDEWTTEGLGDPDEFETVEEAEEAIGEMLGAAGRRSDYYRVSEIEEV